MSEREEGVESPVAYLDDCVRQRTLVPWFLCSWFLGALVAEHLERVGMPLHSAIGTNRRNAETTEVKAQVPDIFFIWYLLFGTANRARIFSCPICHATLWA